MLQLGLDNVGELLRFCNRRRRLFGHNWSGRSRKRGRSLLSSFARLTQSAKMFPNLVGQFIVERAGMRLFLNPEYGEVLQDELTLHLQFTRQYVDSYITHSAFSVTPPRFPPSTNGQAEICGPTC
jgi:hypothetical protein